MFFMYNSVKTSVASGVIWGHGSNKAQSGYGSIALCVDGCALDMCDNKVQQTWKRLIASFTVIVNKVFLQGRFVMDVARQCKSDK